MTLKQKASGGGLAGLSLHIVTKQVFLQPQRGDHANASEWLIVLGRRHCLSSTRNSFIYGLFLSFLSAEVTDGASCGVGTTFVKTGEQLVRLLELELHGSFLNPSKKQVTLQPRFDTSPLTWLDIFLCANLSQINQSGNTSHQLLASDMHFH